MPRHVRRSAPKYPRLALAAALGTALGVSGCGPDGPEDLDELQRMLQEAAKRMQVVDAGTQPRDSDYYGGGAPFEVLPAVDAGTAQ